MQVSASKIPVPLSELFGVIEGEPVGAPLGATLGTLLGVPLGTPLGASDGEWLGALIAW